MGSSCSPDSAKQSTECQPRKSDRAELPNSERSVAEDNSLKLTGVSMKSLMPKPNFDDMASNASPGATSDGNAIQFKICILGDSGVGKTCIVNRLCKGTFSDTNSTVGAAFSSKVFVVNGNDMTSRTKLKIWDTAGSDRYKHLTKKYYSGAHAVVVCYDITSMDSFVKLQFWVEEIRENVESIPLIFLVGNKADNAANSEVDISKASQFAKKVKSKLYETSAKDNTGILPLF